DRVRPGNGARGVAARRGGPTNSPGDWCTGGWYAGGCCTGGSYTGAGAATGVGSGVGTVCGSGARGVTLSGRRAAGTSTDDWDVTRERTGLWSETLTERARRRAPPPRTTITST